MAKFEFVEKYKNCELELPSRSTEKSAGYDIACAEDIIIPAYVSHYNDMKQSVDTNYVTLQQMAGITKSLKTKPTLVPTGLKCKLEDNEYLELLVRSSTPLKYWLVMANSVGRL